MGTKLSDIINKLPPKRRAKVEARAAQLIAEEHTLRDLRKALELTQTSVAQHLEIGQDSVSRLEQRGDLLISTLKEYIEALGGDLRLIAEFPNRPPVEVTGLGAIAESGKNKKGAKKSRTRGDSHSNA